MSSNDCADFWYVGNFGCLTLQVIARLKLSSSPTFSAFWFIILLATSDKTQRLKYIMTDSKEREAFRKLTLATKVSPWVHSHLHLLFLGALASLSSVAIKLFESVQILSVGPVRSQAVRVQEQTVSLTVELHVVDCKWLTPTARVVIKL